MQLQWRSMCLYLVLGSALHTPLMGCASVKGVDTVLHESRRGTVSLAPLKDGSLQTSHPLSIDSSLVTSMLKRIEVQEPENVVAHLLGSGPKRVLAFSESDAIFLGPLISTALGQASSTQQVKFKLSQLARSENVTTSGTVSAHGPLLYVTLTQYHANAKSTDTNYMANRQLSNSATEKEVQVGFLVDGAFSNAGKQHPVVMDPPDSSTVVINYKVLSAFLEQKPEATISKTGSGQEAAVEERMKEESVESLQTHKRQPLETEEIRRVKDLVIKKDLEVEGLKEDLRGLRRQLSERDAEVQILRGELDTLKKTAPSPQLKKKGP